MAVEPSVWSALHDHTFGQDPGIRGYTTIGSALVLQAALFVISCVAAAGILPNTLFPTIAGLTVGLAAGSYGLILVGGNLEERKESLIRNAFLTLIPIIMGALGAAGVVTAVQMGWGVAGAYITVIGLNLAVGCCACCCACCLTAAAFAGGGSRQ